MENMNSTPFSAVNGKLEPLEVYKEQLKAVSYDLQASFINFVVEAWAPIVVNNETEISVQTCKLLFRVVENYAQAIILAKSVDEVTNGNLVITVEIRVDGYSVPLNWSDASTIEAQVTNAINFAITNGLAVRRPTTLFKELSYDENTLNTVLELGKIPSDFAVGK